MGQGTAIEWADHSFNPWIGCTKVSKGCEFCYALSEDRRRGHSSWGPKGLRRMTSPQYWRNPDKWNREAEARGERYRVFCASMADVFDEWKGQPITNASGEFEGSELYVLPDGAIWVPGYRMREDARPATLDDLRAHLWDKVEDTPWLLWLLLTKRPQNILKMVPARWLKDGAPDNVVLGTSVEDRKTAKERVPALWKAALDLGAQTFLSMEPLLEMVSIEDFPDVGQIVVGGESGPKARPFDVAWPRAIVEQSRARRIPVFVKQLGSRPVRTPAPYGAQGHRLTLQDRKGGDMGEWPEELRVRETPERGRPR